MPVVAHYRCPICESADLRDGSAYDGDGIERPLIQCRVCDWAGPPEDFYAGYHIEGEPDDCSG